MSWLKQAQSHVKHLCPVYLQFPHPPQKESVLPPWSEAIVPTAAVWKKDPCHLLVHLRKPPEFRLVRLWQPIAVVSVHPKGSYTDPPPSRGYLTSRDHTKPKGQDMPLILKKYCDLGFLSQSWCILYTCFFSLTISSFRTLTSGGSFPKNGSQRPSAVKTSITLLLLLCSLTPRRLAKNIKCWRTVKTS